MHSKKFSQFVNLLKRPATKDVNFSCKYFDTQTIVHKAKTPWKCSLIKKKSFEKICFHCQEEILKHNLYSYWSKFQQVEFKKENEKVM